MKKRILPLLLFIVFMLFLAASSVFSQAKQNAVKFNASGLSQNISNYNAKNNELPRAFYVVPYLRYHLYFKNK